jgi:hypothetical protein
MKHTPLTVNHKSGISLIAVLMFMLAATTASVVIFRVIGSENFSSGARLKQSEAYQASESGVDALRSWMSNRGADVGALVRLYETNGNKPVRVNLGGVGGSRGQDFEIYLTGIDMKSKPMRLKFLVEGKARDNSKVSQAVIFSVDGLYKVHVPGEVKYGPPARIPGYFGGSLNLHGSKTLSSAIIIGDLTGNPAEIKGDLVVTGNVKMSGTGITVDSSLCVGGDFNPNNNMTVIKGDAYIGSSPNLLGDFKGNLYCNGDIQMTHTGTGMSIDGSLTVNGKLTFTGGRSYPVGGDFVLGDSPDYYHTAHLNYDGIGIGYNFTVCGNVWTMNPSGVQGAVLDINAEVNACKASCDGNTNVGACKTACEGSETTCRNDCGSENTCDSNATTCKTGCENNTNTCRNNCQNASQCNRNNFQTAGCQENQFGTHPASNNMETCHNYCVTHCQSQCSAPEANCKNQCDATSANCKITLVDCRNQCDATSTSCKNQCDATSDECKNQCDASPDQYHTQTDAKVHFSAGRTSANGCVQNDNANLAFQSAVFMASNTPKVNYRTSTTTGYFRSHTGVSFNSAPTVDGKLAAARPAKDYCDDIWVPVPPNVCANGGDYGGGDYIVNDPIASSLDTIKRFLDRVSSPAPALPNGFQCLNTATVSIGSRGHVDVNGTNQRYQDLLNGCYNLLAQQENQPNLFNGYYIVKLSQEQHYEPNVTADTPNDINTKLNGKFIFIYPNNNGNVYIPPTTKDSKVMMFFEQGAGTLGTKDECANDVAFNYFIYSMKNIDELLTWPADCPLTGNIYFPARSCASVVSVNNNFGLQENPDLISDLMQAGILCINEQGLRMPDSYCTNQERENTMNPPDDPEDKDPPPNPGFTDTHWIPIANRLAVKLENKKISRESATAASTLGPSILVMPRVIRLTPGQVSTVAGLSDYYTYMHLNGAAAASSENLTALCPTYNSNSKGVYTCTFGNATNVSNFHIIVGNVGDSPDFDNSSSSVGGSGGDGHGEISSSSSATPSSSSSSDSGGSPVTVTCAVGTQRVTKGSAAIPNASNLTCSNGATATNIEASNVDMNVAGIYNNIQVSANCGGVGGSTTCTGTLTVVELTCAVAKNSVTQGENIGPPTMDCSNGQLSKNNANFSASSGALPNEVNNWRNTTGNTNAHYTGNAAVQTNTITVSNVSCGGTNFNNINCGNISVARPTCGGVSGNRTIGQLIEPNVSCGNATLGNRTFSVSAGTWNNNTTTGGSFSDAGPNRQIRLDRVWCDGREVVIPNNTVDCGTVNIVSSSSSGGGGSSSSSGGGCQYQQGWCTTAGSTSYVTHADVPTTPSTTANTCFFVRDVIRLQSGGGTQNFDIAVNGINVARNHNLSHPEYGPNFACGQWGLSSCASLLPAKQDGGYYIRIRTGGWLSDTEYTTGSPVCGGSGGSSSSSGNSISITNTGNNTGGPLTAGNYVISAIGNCTNVRFNCNHNTQSVGCSIQVNDGTTYSGGHNSANNIINPVPTTGSTLTVVGTVSNIWCASW